MGRQAQEFAQTTEVVLTDADTPGLPAMKEALDQVAIVDHMIMEKCDVIKSLGRIEAASFMATVAEKMIAETAINLREGKKYKGLPYQDENGNWRRVATFEEFCEHKLGKSRRRVAELMSNYKDLGPELYEQAEKLGFRQRDYNALKALPENDRTLIEQAIATPNLDNALELLQQLAEKHGREKVALSQETEELKKQTKALEAVIEGKGTQITRLEKELASERQNTVVLAHIDWPEAFEGLIAQVQLCEINALKNITALDVIRADAMFIQPESPEEAVVLERAKEALATKLVHTYNQLIEIVEGLGLTFDKTLGGYTEARLSWFTIQKSDE